MPSIPLWPASTPRRQSASCQLVIIINVGVLTYLGSEVESEVAVVCQRVLDHERHVGRQAQLDSARKTTSLAEVDEVLERECERDWLRQLNVDV